MPGCRARIDDLGENAFAGDEPGLFLLEVFVPRAVQQGIARRPVDRLAFEQNGRHQVHLVRVCGEHLFCRVVGLLHQARDLGVDGLGRLLGVIGGIAVVASEEDLVIRLAERLVPQFVGHAVVHDHLARLLGRALQVVRGARGDIAAEQLFGDATAQEHRQIVDHGSAADEELVLVRNGHRVAERHAARHDRDLMDRIGMLEQMPDQRMAGLMVRDGAARLLGQDAVLALRSCHQTFQRFIDLGHTDGILVAASREERGLVHEVHKIGAGHAARQLGDAHKVDVGAERLVLGVHLEDLLASAHIGRIDDDLTVEAAGAQQRRVEHVDAVRRRDQHDGVVLLETVHLDEQLVQRLLAFVVAAQPGAPLAADGIDLVDEDDGRRRILRLLEKAAHAARAHADEHLDELGAGNAEERDLGFSGDRARKQRLARARRPDEQAAARDLRAELLVLARIHQEVLDLLKLLDRLVLAGDVGETHVGAFFHGLFRLGAAERHLGVVRLGELDEEEDHERGEHEHRHQTQKRIGNAARKFDLVFDLRMLLHELHEGILAHIGGHVGRLRAQRLLVEGLRLHAERRRIGRRKERAELDVDGFERRVVGIGRGRSCGRSRIVRA